MENRPDIISWRLADAVAASSLPREDKVELLALAACNKTLTHRTEALWLLKNLDRERFAALLAATFDDLPGTPSGLYSNCIEKDFVPLACETDDPKVQQALRRAMKRADPGLRIQMLDRMAHFPLEPYQRRWFLTFLASFLDDATLRDVSANENRYTNSFTGSPFRRLEIRNFAALSIAQLLDISDQLSSEWTEEEWSNLRDCVRLAVKCELAESAKD